MDKITVNKNDITSLIEYVHTLLDFIDVDDFDDEENIELVKGGYKNFVEPIIEVIY